MGFFKTVIANSILSYDTKDIFTFIARNEGQDNKTHHPTYIYHIMMFLEAF